MKQPGISLILSTCILLTAAGILSAAEPVIIADDYVQPGAVLQILIQGGHLNNVSLSIENSRKESLSRNQGFLWTAPYGESVSVVLLGIPSTITPGRYTLVMNADQGRAQWHLEKAVTVTEHPFPEQVINLDDKSYSISPEMVYTGFTNWELRLRFSYLNGGTSTEYGEKMNSNKLELRLRYFF